MLIHSLMNVRHEGFGGVHPFEAIEGHQRNMVSRFFYRWRYIWVPIAILLARCYKKSSRGSGVRHNGRRWDCLYPGSRWVSHRPLACETLKCSSCTGMGGCLSVGSNAAKNISAATNKPLVAVHHMVCMLLTYSSPMLTKRLTASSCPDTVSDHTWTRSSKVSILDAFSIWWPYFTVACYLCQEFQHNCNHCWREHRMCVRQGIKDAQPVMERIRARRCLGEILRRKRQWTYSPWNEAPTTPHAAPIGILLFWFTFRSREVYCSPPRRAWLSYKVSLGSGFSRSRCCSAGGEDNSWT